jgi:hypothetical protein
MAHFAKLDSDSKVIAVHVVNNDVITDANEQEQEQLGIDFLKNLHGSDTVWKQTSFNTFEGEHSLGGTPHRKNYAGIGYTYDLERDAFIPPQPYNSWTIDEAKCIYVAPVTYPTTNKYTDENGDEYLYLIDWDEDNLRWIATDTSSDNNHYYWDASGLSWTSYTP